MLRSNSISFLKTAGADPLFCSVPLGYMDALYIYGHKVYKAIAKYVVFVEAKLLFMAELISNDIVCQCYEYCYDYNTVLVNMIR